MTHAKAYSAGISYFEQHIAREDAVVDFQLLHGKHSIFTHDMLDGFDSATEGSI